MAIVATCSVVGRKLEMRAVVRHPGFVAFTGVYLVFALVLVLETDTNAWFEAWATYTYQDFGFVKRLLIPSALAAGGVSLRGLPTLAVSIISVLLVLFYGFSIRVYRGLPDGSNRLVCVALLSLMILSPASMFRLAKAAFHDGVGLAIFISSVLLIFSGARVWRVLAVAVIPGSGP